MSKGRATDAHAVLAAICTWFSEGFDTLDWRDAVTLRDGALR